LRVKYLFLRNFRNFQEFETKFAPEGAIISGKNGLGKTNLLEALSYFAFGKSFRTNYDLDLIDFSKAFFRILGNFELSDKEIIIEAAFEKQKKIVKIDKINISRISELYRYLKIVYFSPEDINIIGGAPSYRRYFFDQAISQYNFQYLAVLRKYFQVLKQRNALLKNDFKEKEKYSWDLQFIEIGSKVIEFRNLYLEKFGSLINKKYAAVTNDNEQVEIKYRFSFPNPATESVLDNMREHVDDVEEQEKNAQRSLFGPHLDDYEFSINGNSARRFASQGQKKSLAITSRLVQANLITEKPSEFPILIFDDVFAELDKKRIKNIMKVLEDKHQIFIATPNKEIYKGIKLPLIDLEKVI